MCSPFFGSTKPRHGKRSDARLVLITIGALLATAALAEQAALYACTADEVNAAFVRAKTCVDSHNSVAPEVSDKTKFCNHVKEVGDHCFEKCACMAVDSCDGNTKAVPPLANQAQKDIFEGVCNSHNDNGCSGEFNPKCAAAAGAAGLRAGVVTMLVVAAFALLVGH